MSPWFVLLVTLLTVVMVIRAAITVTRENSKAKEKKDKKSMDSRLGIALVLCVVLAWFVPGSNLFMFILSVVMFAISAAIAVWSIGNAPTNMLFALVGSVVFACVLFLGLVMLSSSLRAGGFGLGLLWFLLAGLAGYLLTKKCNKTARESTTAVP